MVSKRECRHGRRLYGGISYVRSADASPDWTRDFYVSVGCSLRFLLGIDQLPVISNCENSFYLQCYMRGIEGVSPTKMILQMGYTISYLHRPPSKSSRSPAAMQTLHSNSLSGQHLPLTRLLERLANVAFNRYGSFKITPGEYSSHIPPLCQNTSSQRFCG